MEELLDMEEKLDAVFVRHKCRVTAQMLADWQHEKNELSEKYSHPELGIVILNLTNGFFEFHNNVHEKWLLHPAIDLTHPNDHSLLKDLTTDADRITFIRNLLVGYDLLMSLPPGERKHFRMKFHLSLKNKNHKPICYVIGLKVYKFDESDSPWLLIIKIVRLSATWVPLAKPYCEYSHRLNKNICRIHKVKPLIVKKLTALEAEVLKLGHEGYSIPETAEMMGSNDKRIKNTRERIFRKTNTHNIKQANLYIQKHELVD
ncbi:hypothetical protein [Flavobacterium sp. UBA6031]|uniref:hypothetical protein n=1 Tax=Flavobacterium sp. UBA6031 TaxID=1946551 RepID=UPI0025C03274|nr:hypothetical protein [Flavobacterium sp. UBA6031]